MRGSGSCTYTWTLTDELSQPQQVRELELTRSSRGGESQVPVPNTWTLTVELSQPQQVRKLELTRSSGGGEIQVPVPVPGL